MHLCPNAGLHETGQVRRLNMILSLGLMPYMGKGSWAGVPVLSWAYHLKLVEKGMMLVMVRLPEVV